ncbi:hypothetical protein BKA62DRAFT_620146 [Auriculariales sp. MPI-PUGE-AT-0066]|nr:hypothetical protein BKA62DRAFT_620146 [Auriculariales sp. MPI-PUGE-AT-0066]
MSPVTSGGFPIQYLSRQSGSDVRELVARKGGGGGGRGGGSRGGGGSRASSSGSSNPSAFSLSSASGRTASPKSSGGGKPIVLPSGPFQGRLVGGGSRKDIYGDARYGSGYPGTSGSRSVSGAPFPFGFYPIFIPGPSPSLHSSEEYSSDVPGLSRPGGAMSTEIVVSKSLGREAGVFYLVGDSSSVALVFSAIVANCNATNLDQPLATLTYPLPAGATNVTMPDTEEIIQYYRASSFALALEGYNSSVATAPSESQAYAGPVGLPASVDASFLQCINATTAEFVPIMDAPEKYHLTTNDIVWIVFGSIVGAFLLLYSCCWLSLRIATCCDERRSRKERVRKDLENASGQAQKKTKTIPQNHPAIIEPVMPVPQPCITSRPDSSTLTLATMHSHLSDSTAVSSFVSMKDKDGFLAIDTRKPPLCYSAS